MKTVFSTKLVHPRDKFDFWHSVARKDIVDHDSRPANRLGFEAQIDTGVFGSFELVHFRNSSMRVSHTMRHIAHATTVTIRRLSLRGHQLGQPYGSTLE